MNCTLYVLMYACLSVCMHMCVLACISNVYSHVTVHIFGMSLNKYSYHIANMSDIAIMLNGRIDPTSCVHVPKHKKS